MNTKAQNVAAAAELVRSLQTSLPVVQATNDTVAIQTAETNLANAVKALEDAERQPETPVTTESNAVIDPIPHGQITNVVDLPVYNLTELDPKVGKKSVAFGLAKDKANPLYELNNARKTGVAQVDPAIAESVAKNTVGFASTKMLATALRRSSGLTLPNGKPNPALISFTLTHCCVGKPVLDRKGNPVVDQNGVARVFTEPHDQSSAITIKLPTVVANLYGDKADDAEIARLQRIEDKMSSATTGSTADEESFDSIRK